VIAMPDDEKKQLAPFETVMGPAMVSLANDRQRAFVDALFAVPPGHGAMAAAARVAGYEQSTPHVLTATANRLMRDPKIQAAIAEETKRRLRAAGPAAVKAIEEIIADPSHRDRLKASMAVIERHDPVTQRIEGKIEHMHTIDHEAEALNQLRTLRALNVTREKLIEVFGEFGLQRLEATLSLEDRSAPQVVDAEYVEITPEPESDPDAALFGE
jgi:phage terminase small subunit